MAEMGRPPIFTEEKLEQLKALMRMMPTLEDTAAYFQCGTTTVEDTIKKHFGVTFREFRDQNMVHTRLQLKRTAIQKANSGDNTMLIFCLKNLCDWSDKTQLSHSAEGSAVGGVLVYLPDNGRKPERDPGEDK